MTQTQNWVKCTVRVHCAHTLRTHAARSCARSRAQRSGHGRTLCCCHAMGAWSLVPVAWPGRYTRPRSQHRFPLPNLRSDCDTNSKSRPPRDQVMSRHPFPCRDLLYAHSGISGRDTKSQVATFQAATHVATPKGMSRHRFWLPSRPHVVTPNPGRDTPRVPYQ